MSDRDPSEVVASLEREHRAIWRRAADTYVAGVESLTRGAVDALLDAAAVGPATVLLDVGTGPGTLIGPALERGAVVHAVDLTPEMVELAGRRFPGVDVRVANATELPFPDGSFDAVTLPFCLHHMAEPASALAEVYRVLKPGGRVALTVWAPDEQLEAFGLAFGALEGLDAEVPFPSALPLDGAPPEACSTLLTAAGFAEAEHRQLDLAWKLDDPTPLADLMSRFLGLDACGSDVVREYTANVDAAVRKRNARVGNSLVPNPAILATALREL